MRLRREARLVAGLILVLAVTLIASVLLTGCGRRAARQETGQPAVEASQTAPSTGEGEQKIDASLDEGKARELDVQLTSLDKELGGVQLPDDKGLDSAASALE